MSIGLVSAALIVISVDIVDALSTTRGTLQCHDSSSATASVSLTKDRSTIAATTIGCGPSMKHTSVEIVTNEKPNDFEVSMSVSNASTTTTCIASGTSFPATVDCPPSGGGAVARVGHPHP